MGDESLMEPLGNRATSHSVWLYVDTGSYARADLYFFHIHGTKMDTRIFVLKPTSWHRSFHLDTGFPWFSWVLEQMLGWFPFLLSQLPLHASHVDLPTANAGMVPVFPFPVATTCFPCSPPYSKWWDGSLFWFPFFLSQLPLHTSHVALPTANAGMVPVFPSPIWHYMLPM
jgi:hypothetical protein